MLRTLLAALCLHCVAAGVHISRRVCYGATFTFPPEVNGHLTTGELAFRPSLGGPRQTLVKEGKVMVTDPRFTYSHGTLSLRDVTKRDEGFYIFSFTSLNLRLNDCAERTEREYATRFYRSPVDFDYVEFSHVYKQDEITVVWNRSDPVGWRGRTRINRYVWEMDAVTPLDKGFYNFRRKDSSLVKRIELYVTGHRKYFTVTEGEELVINYPGFDIADAFWTVTFSRGLELSLMKNGNWIVDDEDGFGEHRFGGRVVAEQYRLAITPVTMEDQGTFEFKDKDGFLILTVEVSVKEAPTPPYHYVLGFAAFLAPMFLCCCCVAKCCGEEDGSKSEDATQDAATPDVQNQDASTSPAHSYPVSPAGASSYQPVPLISSTGQDPSQQPPAYDSLDVQAILPPPSSQPKIPVPPSYQPASGEELPTEAPPSYDTVVIHETPPRPASEFTAPVPSSSMATNYLSSDSEPRFELRGIALPSAPPLESDSTPTNVYNSDNLNFL